MASQNSHRNYTGLYIKDGLVNRRRFNLPRPSFILDNIVRLIKINQIAQLAIQTTLDGWGSTPLVPIPDNRFFIGNKYDFNDLACNVLYTLESNSPDGGIDNYTLQVAIVNSVEQHIEPDDLFRRSESMLLSEKETLKTYFDIAPNELRFDYVNANSTSNPTTQKSTDFIDVGIENPQIVGIGVISLENMPGVSGKRKSLGFLPSLNIKMQLTSSTN